MSLFTVVKRGLYPLTSRYLSNAILVEGHMKGTDMPFRSLFVENSGYERYMFASIYETPPRVLKQWKIWIRDLSGLLKTYSDSIDICIAVLPNSYESRYAGLYAFKGQDFVRQVIDTTGTWDEIIGRFHQKKRQFSNNAERKFGLGYKVSHDLDDFDLFYHRMHLPHIRSQFDAFADIDSYEDLKSYFIKGFVLMIMADGIKMAGALCLVENNSLVFRRSGVLDGDEEYRKRGAQLALYHFNIRYAWEHGIPRVDTMKSRPFFNDGVYRTKREWGSHVLADDEAESTVYYFIPRYSPEISTFVETNPVIIQNGEGLSGLVSRKEASCLAEENIRDLYKKFHAPGIGSLLLLDRDGRTEELILEAPRKEAAEKYE
jgi:hypothetical protein